MFFCKSEGLSNHAKDVYFGTDDPSSQHRGLLAYFAAALPPSLGPGLCVLLEKASSLYVEYCTLSGTIASVESYLCRKSSVNCSALQRCIVRKVCHPFEFGTILLPKKQCYCFTEYFAHSACRTCTCGKYFMAIGQDFGGKELLFGRALHMLIQGNTSFLHVRHLDS